MPYKDLYKDPEYHKKYRAAHKDRTKKYNKMYKQTPEGRKKTTITNWKRRGLIETDQYTYDDIYLAYLCQSNCELCDIELTIDRYNTSTTKCMDHDHSTGIFRDFVCHSCNIKRG